MKKKLKKTTQQVFHNVKNEVKYQVYDKQRIIISLIGIAIMITIISLTLGRILFSGKEATLSSFALTHFLGYLFFILMPVEALVPFYLNNGANGLTLFIIAIPTAMLAQTFDFLIGSLFSEKIITTLVGHEKVMKAGKKIKKYGRWSVFLFNLFPLSSPIIHLVAGMLRLRFRNVLLISFAGLTLKYAFIIWIFRLLWP